MPALHQWIISLTSPLTLSSSLPPLQKKFHVPRKKEQSRKKIFLALDVCELTKNYVNPIGFKDLHSLITDSIKVTIDWKCSLPPCSHHKSCICICLDLFSSDERILAKLQQPCTWLNHLTQKCIQCKCLIKSFDIPVQRTLHIFQLES